MRRDLIVLIIENPKIQVTLDSNLPKIQVTLDSNQNSQLRMVEREVKGNEEEPRLNPHLPCSVAPTVSTFVVTLTLNHHQEERVYVPELNFEHLLTSSIYYDTVKKTTGGCNGYGAKLTNIFSIEFIIETTNVKTGIKLWIP
ncbi:hypothetical protein C1H46_041193 [Malus baccata]|uniref:DNA topoisomerase (ATP-hydrolyzing) n=1 Tax=Malus baccata TaxID=106549 RepID=A0A540KGC3_MALBA|nr:hypothetical protein C1H46_041193 [Malus baccata]